MRVRREGGGVEREEVEEWACTSEHKFHVHSTPCFFH
jgi:hypothetical protein